MTGLKALAAFRLRNEVEVKGILLRAMAPSLDNLQSVPIYCQVRNPRISLIVYLNFQLFPIMSCKSSHIG